MFGRRYLLQAVLSIVIPGFAIAQTSLGSNFSMLVLRDVDEATTINFLKRLHQQDYRAAVSYANLILGWFSEEEVKNIATYPEVLEVHTRPLTAYPADWTTNQQTVVRFYNNILTGQSAPSGMLFDGPPLQCQIVDPRALAVSLKKSYGLQNAVSYEDTSFAYNLNSERMNGVIACTMLFVESDGTIDNDVFTWSPSSQHEVLTNTLENLLMWTYSAWSEKIKATFHLIIYGLEQAEIMRQPYEPSLNWSIGQFGRWVNPVFERLGYHSIHISDKWNGHLNGLYTAMKRMNLYNYAIRQQLGATWSFVALITGHSASSQPLPVAGGALGGPYVSVPYGYFVTPYNRYVMGHEIGHVFHAGDEYAGGCTKEARYNGTPNLNCQGSLLCLMKEKEGLHPDTWICRYTREHIGWGKQTARARLVSPEADGMVKPGSVAFQWTIDNAELETRLLIREKQTGKWVHGEEWFLTETNRRINLAAGEYEWFVETGGALWSAQQGELRSLTVSEATPADFRLTQNYPNPFNAGTIISIDVPKREHVELRIFDVHGRRVATLLSNEVAAGTHQIPFDGVTLASGIYFCTIKSGVFTATRKMMLLR